MTTSNYWVPAEELVAFNAAIVWGLKLLSHILIIELRVLTYAASACAIPSNTRDIPKNTPAARGRNSVRNLRRRKPSWPAVMRDRTNRPHI